MQDSTAACVTRSRGLWLSAALFIGASVPSMALAQATDGSQAVAAQAEAPSELTEIVVTARKRAETVQDVPATIGVVSQQALANTGANNLQQLQAVAPGINIGKAPTGNEVGVTIRGLGSAPGVPSFDSSVSLFVDGVYAPRSREFAASMFDVERIEVIRGTQAALLGKNTSLGAINLIIRKPRDEFSADLRASYEFDRGSTLLTGGMDVPLSDSLRVRVAGQFSDDNGYVYNVVTDAYAPRIRDTAVRGTAVWEPADNIDATLFIQHDIAKNRASPVEFQAATPVPGILAALAGSPNVIETRLDRRNALSTPSAGGEQTERLLVDKYALTANVGLGDHTLTSITAYSRYTDRNLSDVDLVPGDYLTREVDELGKQFSQELRIVSPSERALDYIIGALYIDGRLRNTTLLSANFPFGPAPGVNVAGVLRTDFDQDGDTESIFGQANYKIEGGFRLSGGLRWTREKKTVDLGRAVVTPGLFSTVIYPPFAPFSLSRIEKNVDYSVGAQYELSHDAMIYASYGKGTKSGGFAQSVSILPDAEYDSETAKTAEIGVKLQDSARRWVFNAAAFNTVVDGFQLVTFTGLEFVVANTDLRSRGVEVETYWYPIDGLRLFLNNTYADAEDRNTDRPIPLAPKWTGTGGFSYETAVTDALDFKADGSIDYRSKRYYQQDPATSPPGEAFTTYNLSIAVAANDDRWEARLIGRNLTNANAASFAFPTPILPPGNQNAISERGRTVALQMSAKF